VRKARTTADRCTRLTDPEPLADECIQVDTAGDQIASRLRVAEPAILRQNQPIEDFCLDEDQVVTASAATGRCERARLGCIPSPAKPRPASASASSTSRMGPVAAAAMAIASTVAWSGGSARRVREGRGRRLR
jgi:hypothetical protein